MKQLRHLFSFSRFIILIEIILLFFFLYWHYRIGMVRYFDQDELAHLHWGYNFFSGVKPYTQFLYFFPPGFLLFLYPIFLLVGKSVYIYTGARFSAFLVFLLFSAVLFLLTKEARNSKTALLAVVIFAFLPVPFDKLLEIRPDNLATVFSILGLYFLIKAIRKINGWFMFLAGLSFGISLFILTKMIFFLTAAGAVITIYAAHSSKSPKSLRLLRRLIIAFAAGLTIPFLITLFIFFSSGDFSKSLYLTTKFASVSSKVLGDKFRIIPNLWFYSVESFYTSQYPNLYYLLTLIIYFLAILWGIVRIISCLDRKDGRSTLVEILLGVSFYANLVAYLYIFPLKHSQYIIPFAPFIAFYAADLISSTGAKLKGKSHSAIFSFLLLTLLLMMAWETERVGKIKKNWTNQQTITNFDKASKIIPEDSFVLDLYGETVFYPDPYYICCLPYGQYTEAFDFRLMALSKKLVETKTKYIYARDPDRLTVLPSNEENFIRDNYLPVASVPLILVPGKKMKTEKNRQAEFDIIAGGKYKLFWNGEKMESKTSMDLVMINDKIIEENPVVLPEGKNKIMTKEPGEVRLVYTE